MTIGIHASAVVRPGARIDETATVGPFCFVGADVVLERGVEVRPRAVIEGAVRIGEGARVGEGVVIQGPALIGPRAALFPYAVLGQVGQFPGHHRTDGLIEIGGEATLREFVVVNKPVTTAVTRVGQGCYVMARTQIDHDCILEPFVKTATGVTLGGSVHVESHAYLGMNAVVHQGLRIGCACMIGMNGVVTAHVPPYVTLVDRRITHVNAIGLARLGADDADIARIEAYLRANLRTYAYGVEAPPHPADDPWIAVVRIFLDRIAPAPVARFAPAR